MRPVVRRARRYFVFRAMADDAYVVRDLGDGAKAIRFDLTSSTMDRAKELCKTYGDDEWLLVTARQQSHGRGTNGRKWVAPVGNAYLSICVPKRPDVLPIQRLMFLPLETGVAVVAAIDKHTPADVAVLPTQAPGKQLGVKWPNDVLMNAAKVSGNLIEDGGSHMVVGIGVNVAVAPEVNDGGRAPACLKDYGMACSDEVVAEEIFHALRRSLLAPRVDGIVKRYAAMMDWSATVHERNPDGSRGAPGTPVELNEYGHLVVRQATGTKTLINEYLF
eukprot:TRINITY_DN30909_c0_g1_i1.p1 TRINITY_DN30909_c0_g1~~TRINITY_DN30909_c0_g1_i1.p1  ORF type:complete len:276 (+),score=61.80 TRINITY_DN30909_c0_g1_i1:20-847(+)